MPMWSMTSSKKSHLFQQQYVLRVTLPLLLSITLNALQNAFHSKFTGFNTFLLFVVDLMHEFELGVFKDFLIHLLRLLHSCGPATIAEFNRQ